MHDTLKTAKQENAVEMSNLNCYLFIISLAILVFVYLQPLIKMLLAVLEMPAAVYQVSFILVEVQAQSPSNRLHYLAE